MEKTLLALLTLVVALYSCSSQTLSQPIKPDETDGVNIVFSSEPEPTGEFATIMKRFKNPKDNYVQICAHRGVSEIVPENSVAGIKKCIELGFDIIEIDLAKTKDGRIVLMHDKTLERTTTGKGNVSDFTLAEIKKLYLKDINGKVTTERMPTLEEALDVAKGNIFVQMDKWNGLTEIVLPIIKEKQCLQQSIFRSTLPYENIKATFKEYLDKIVYIPVIPAGRQEAQNILNGYLQNMPEMPVICIVFPDENNPMLSQVAELKRNIGFGLMPFPIMIVASMVTSKLLKEMLKTAMVGLCKREQI